MDKTLAMSGHLTKGEQLPPPPTTRENRHNAKMDRQLRNRKSCCCACDTCMRAHHKGHIPEVTWDLGLHGARRFMRPMKTRKGRFKWPLRRIFWGVVLGMVTAMFLYQTFTCVMFYLSNVMLYTRVFASHAEAPPMAITVCNANPLRLSEISKRGWLPWLQELHSPTTSKRATAHPEAYNTSARELYTSAGHTIERLLLSCRVDNRQCRQRNFSASLTDMGLCYTVNGTELKGWSSLSLYFNTGHLDASPFALDGSGLRLLFHPADVHPTFGAGAVYLPTGALSHIRVDADVVEQESGCAAPPVGTHSQCSSACERERVVRRCNCSPFWSSVHHSEAPCTVGDHMICVKSLTTQRAAASPEPCSCSEPCRYVHYRPHVSSTTLSLEDVTRLLRPSDVTNIKKGLREAADERGRALSSWEEVDSRKILDFTHALDDVVFRFESFRQTVRTVSLDLKQTMQRLKQRTWFHYHVALNGMKKTIEQGFFRAWENVDERSLRSIVVGFHEMIADVDRTIQKLLTTTSSEVTMRKVLYFLLENELASRLELSIHALDNFTKVYYSFLNVEPTANTYIVTPDRRYDQSLVPYMLISDTSDSLKDAYEGISEHLAGYMEYLLVLKNVLKEVYQTNDVNDTAYSGGKIAFLHHARQVDYYVNNFRTKVVDKLRVESNRRLDQFKKFNHSMHNSADSVLFWLEDVLWTLDHDYAHGYAALARFAQSAQRLIAKDHVQMSELVDDKLLSDARHGLTQILGVAGQMRAHHLDSSRLWRHLEARTKEVWTDMLENMDLATFYSQLYKDVLDMVKNPMKSTFYLDIFTHRKMLSKDANEIQGLAPQEYYTLLNADLALMDSARKASDIQEVTSSFMRRTDLDSSLEGSDRTLKESFDSLHEHLESFKDLMDINDQFVRHSVVGVHLTPGQFGFVQHKPAHTMADLFARIGGLLPVLLGASLLTMIEIIDVALSAWFCRSPSEAKQPTTNSTTAPTYMRSPTVDDEEDPQESHLASNTGNNLGSTTLLPPQVHTPVQYATLRRTPEPHLQMGAGGKTLQRRQDSRHTPIV